jgi:hypothetical protein
MLTIPATIADTLTLPRRGLTHVPDLDGRTVTEAEPPRDIHEVDELLGDESRLEAFLERDAERRQAELAGARGLMALASSSSQPRLLRKATRNLGNVWDYRHITAANGGRINPLIHVDHIPVIRQMAGRADLDVLRRVLLAQGLMVQYATDAEGNVAIYCDPAELCFHARGANSVGCGTEHMHLTVAEKWTRKQLNAAAFIRARNRRRAGIPTGWAQLGSGNGFVTVRRRGNTGHENVSNRAGFHDRSDPGDLFPEGEVKERADFFIKHHTFERIG